jgi:hypothetical protein
MRLYEADCHLELARLHLAAGYVDRAQSNLQTARAMGYRRRDAELAAVHTALGQGRNPAGAP